MSQTWSDLHNDNLNSWIFKQLTKKNKFTKLLYHPNLSTDSTCEGANKNCLLSSNS